MFYVSMKAHDNQKIPIENTQKRIRKVSKHITAKKSMKHKERKWRKQEHKNYMTDKTIDKMVIVSLSLSIITLNVNTLNPFF